MRHHQTHVANGATRRDRAANQQTRHHKHENAHATDLDAQVESIAFAQHQQIQRPRIQR
jgi:hypothetical protein